MKWMRVCRACGLVYHAEARSSQYCRSCGEAREAARAARSRATGSSGGRKFSRDFTKYGKELGMKEGIKSL